LITRNLLEGKIPKIKARQLVDQFFSDRATYPDYDFYSHKRGINKDIIEEFYPLLLLAEYLPSATSLCVSPDSLPGPDGFVFLEDGSELTIQVTLSHERSDGYKVRQSLRDAGIWAEKARNTSDVITKRLERILEAIQDKETNFREGTDILLVVDKSISWGDVIDPGLPNALKKAVVSLPPSRYSATYVIYGTDVRKVVR
jgi:hypothetical protein